MTIRSVFGFLISLLVTAAIALAQQAPPAQPQMPPTPPTAIEPFGQAFSLFVEGGSFLGVYAEDINRENMGRYGLREARGAGITSVIKDSPAEKAGLRKDDVILRFDNESVTSVRKLNRLVSEVAPDQTVRLGISRGGSEQEVAVTIGKRDDYKNALQDWHGKIAPLGGGKMRIEGFEELGKDGFAFSFGNNRRIGVSTTTLTKQLAEYFGVPDGKGVLVTSVVEDGPAAKAGIKAGDVITALDGEKIEDAGDLSRALNKKKEGDVTLTVIRNKSARTFPVTPKAGDTIFHPGTVGRRVIVPRIELPTIPEMNISIPRIELPTIPEINVNIQRSPGRRVKTISSPRPI
ncbi:MAG: PDZ domain-containing protein [Pyrinomonadaceae bacterium]